MLYHLFIWLERAYEPPGFQVFEFISVRTSLAAATALFIALVFGKRAIRWLQARQFQETIREGESAGAIDHSHKKGTPTMGGIIILASLLGGTILWADLTNLYVWLAILVTAWMGAFGFADDYIKVVKKDKGGLRKRTKLVGQIGLGLILGAILYFHPQFADTNTLTQVPFVKDRVFDYDLFSLWFDIEGLGWLIYIPVVVFILTALSNAVNLTDGLDGLAGGVTAIVALGLLALVYVAGNVNYAAFLNVEYLIGAGELSVFVGGLAAACFGFLWYNGYPAQVFMGDTGALAMGAAIGAVALMVKQELLLPVLCGAFLLETLSVIIQTTYFKYTRKKTGTGQRIFKMAPIHHHFEVQGIHESKIVTRFWIVTALLVIFALLILRIR